MSVSITNINKSISDVRSVRAKNCLVALFSAAHNVICFYLVVRRTNMIGFKSLFSLFCIKSNNSFVLWNFMYLKMPNDMRLGRGTITWLGYFMGMCEWIMQWMVKNRPLSLSLFGHSNRWGIGNETKSRSTLKQMSGQFISLFV